MRLGLLFPRETFLKKGSPPDPLPKTLNSHPFAKEAAFALGIYFDVSRTLLHPFMRWGK